MPHNRIITIKMFISELGVERTLQFESHYLGDDLAQTSDCPASSAELVIDTVMDGERSWIDDLSADEFAELEQRVDAELRGNL